MTERQARILTSLIREYIRTAEPVGSEGLVQRFRLPMSPATVRAEFATLEDDGYLTHPHTSAGRVPTDHGYRYFVNTGIEQWSLSAREATQLQEELTLLHTESRRIARRMAKLLADISHHLAVTGVAEREEFHEAGLPALLQEPEFADADPVLDVSRLLDALDAHLEEIAHEPIRRARVYIGGENPYVRTPHVSMIVRTCEFPSGERGALVIIGPIRMRYDRNVSLLEEASRLIGASPGGLA